MKFSKALVAIAVLSAIVAIPSVLSLLQHAPPASAQDGDAILILYSQEGFQGRSIKVTGSLADLPKETLADGSDFDWNDNVRSLRVQRGTWRLYQNGRFNTELDETALESLVLGSKPTATGWSCLVSAGSQGDTSYSNGAAGGCGVDVSSVELVSTSNLPDWALSLRVNK